MMLLQGGAATEAPVKVGFPLIDIATGISAAEAILAAVVRRLRGDTSPIAIDVSMVDSALALMSGPAAAAIATGRAPRRVGNRGFVGSPGADTFATANGHISVAANTMGQFAILCRLLGRSDLAVPPHVPCPGLASDAFLTDVATEELRSALAEAFTGAEAHKLESMLNAEGVPAARVRDLHTWKLAASFNAVTDGCIRSRYCVQSSRKRRSIRDPRDGEHPLIVDDLGERVPVCSAELDVIEMYLDNICRVVGPK